MRRTAAAFALLALLVLGGAAADESRKPAPATAEDPDASFLEFLGSVDRLHDVNPDYLKQTDPRLAHLSSRPRWLPPPPPPPPPSPPEGKDHD